MNTQQLEQRADYGKCYRREENKKSWESWWERLQVVRSTGEGFISRDRQETGPLGVRQIEVGTLGLSGNEKSFLASSQQHQRAVIFYLREVQWWEHKDGEGLFHKTWSWRMTWLPALWERIAFPGQTGRLISCPTSLQFPWSLLFELFNSNLINHIFLQCILGTLALNIFLSKSEY